ncbi:hypothetical protein EK21DRAFT_95653 [Setomelanomma holmii]|uniref:Uncharacterized protein n=1 Tax=Setomelanomma holmii TaxID=210430 RepID=A0A9P4LFQ9_9PLEO|nr:hypothetical protein EK21DRAFT_95653 [Setomelanomma holmii]
MILIRSEQKKLVVLGLWERETIYEGEKAKALAAESRVGISPLTDTASAADMFSARHHMVTTRSGTMTMSAALETIPQIEHDVDMAESTRADPYLGSGALGNAQVQEKSLRFRSDNTKVILKSSSYVFLLENGVDIYGGSLNTTHRNCDKSIQAQIQATTDQTLAPDDDLKTLQEVESKDNVQFVGLSKPYSGTKCLWIVKLRDDKYFRTCYKTKVPAFIKNLASEYKNGNISGLLPLSVPPVTSVTSVPFSGPSVASVPLVHYSLQDRKKQLELNGKIITAQERGYVLVESRDSTISPYVVSSEKAVGISQFLGSYDNVFICEEHDRVLKKVVDTGKEFWLKEIRRLECVDVFEQPSVWVVEFAHLDNQLRVSDRMIQEAVQHFGLETDHDLMPTENVERNGLGSNLNSTTSKDVRTSIECPSILSANPESRKKGKYYTVIAERLTLGHRYNGTYVLLKDECGQLEKTTCEDAKRQGLLNCKAGDYPVFNPLEDLLAIKMLKMKSGSKLDGDFFSILDPICVSTELKTGDKKGQKRYEVTIPFSITDKIMNSKAQDFRKILNCSSDEYFRMSFTDWKRLISSTKDVLSAAINGHDVEAKEWAQNRSTSKGKDRTQSPDPDTHVCGVNKILQNLGIAANLNASLEDKLALIADKTKKAM